MHGIDRRRLLAGAAGALLAAPFIARARAAQPIRVGVLADLNGPYATLSGMGAVTAARLAAEDFARIHPQIAVEVVAADFALKPDIGLSIVRNWYDNGGVDCVIDIPMSALALGVSTLVREKNKVALFTGTATDDLTGAYCGPNHLHWTYDSHAMATTVSHGLLRQKLDTWFFIAADYAMGASVVRAASRIITENGGKVLGTVRHPFPSTGDLSSYLLQAQGSGAKVICMANAGDDLVAAIKQASEFGIARNGTVLTAMLMDVPTVHSIGLKDAQGIYYSNAFYWDRDEGTRAFAKRLLPATKGIQPAQNIAGAYSATLHYLKAVAALGVDRAKADGAAAIARMKDMPVEDPLFGRCAIRADGRLLNPLYLLQVKKPEESRYPWDYARITETVAGEQAYRPATEKACPLLR